MLWLVFWSVSPAKAQTLPASCDPADPKSCIQPLLEGEKAPFSGQLLTPRRAAKLAVMVDGCDARLQLKLDETEAVAQIKLDLALTKARLDQQAQEAEIRILKKKLEESVVPWYARPAFVVPVTAIISVALSGLAVWGAIEVLKAS